MNSVSCHDKDFWLREVFRADSISSQHTFFVERVSRGACARCRKPPHHVTRLGDTICELSSAFPRESRNHRCTVTVILAVCKKKKGFKVSFFRVKYDIKNQKIHQFYTSFSLLNFFFFFLTFVWHWSTSQLKVMLCRTSSHWGVFLIFCQHLWLWMRRTNKLKQLTPQCNPVQHHCQLWPQ